MKVIPQHRVIGPYNYDRIIHNIVIGPYNYDRIIHNIENIAMR